MLIKHRWVVMTSSKGKPYMLIQTNKGSREHAIPLGHHLWFNYLSISRCWSAFSGVQPRNAKHINAPLEKWRVSRNGKKYCPENNDRTSASLDLHWSFMLGRLRQWTSLLKTFRFDEKNAPTIHSELAAHLIIYDYIVCSFTKTSFWSFLAHRSLPVCLAMT